MFCDFFMTFKLWKNDVNVASKSNKQKNILNNFFCCHLEGHWRKAGSGSVSFSQRYGPSDPDPYQNVTDLQHWCCPRYWKLWHLRHWWERWIGVANKKISDIQTRIKFGVGYGSRSRYESTLKWKVGSGSESKHCADLLQKTRPSCLFKKLMPRVAVLHLSCTENTILRYCINYNVLKERILRLQHLSYGIEKTVKTLSVNPENT